MAAQSFEQALADLEQITRDLEQGDMSLEESIKMFDKGMQLAGFCSKKLENAQQKVNMLLKKQDGFEAVPFAGDTNGDQAHGT